MAVKPPYENFWRIGGRLWIKTITLQQLSWTCPRPSIACRTIYYCQSCQRMVCQSLHPDSSSLTFLQKTAN
ncbi:hypothetical protein DPMN_010106 [Dreissena polymorpha]|uniref:Uncharacterized protein n=1 Tax=Dreissena polymorpha TaxID=45954 RepID=A0A9D4N1K0_DREPO|nr:hypothetical protein DPMN_010106 [Dreissena polymorpha]